MKKSMRAVLGTGLCGALLALASGCAMFRASTSDVDLDEKKHFDAEFDATDMRAVTQSIVEEILDSDFLTEQPEPPILMIAGLENRTSRHTDMKTLSDRMRTLLIQSGRAQFVNESRREALLREQGYQAAHATPETQTAIGQQLGARYMISGALAEMRRESPRQARISRQEWNYFKLTFEVSDLTTGLIVWTTDREFSRQASKPLIGW